VEAISSKQRSKDIDVHLSRVLSVVEELLMIFFWAAVYTIKPTPFIWPHLPVYPYAITYHQTLTTLEP
jgi:hypothetical protein